jgi:hypothetical protein
LEEIYRPDVLFVWTSFGHPPRPHLSRGRSFTRGRVFTVRRRGKNRVRGHGRSRGRISLPSPLPPSPPSPPPSPSLPSAVRTDVGLRPRGCGKKKKKNKNNFIYFYLKNIFLVVVAGLEREKQFTTYNLQFSVFGFRFSIPELPELRGLRGQSRKKKKVFSA